MASVRELLGNPFGEVEISLLIPSINFDGFKSLYNSLLVGCRNPNSVEMLIKLDNLNDIDKYYKLCSESKFKYKILLYPQYNGRCTLHVFFNDLARLASGKIIWILNDDATVKGQWDTALLSTRNSYPDNIYTIIIPYNEGSYKMVPLPAVTREWLEFFGNELTRFPNFDRWLEELSLGINRRVNVDKKQILVSMPQGHRVLSKEDRKTIFYPTLEKVLRRAKKRLRRI